MRHNLAVAWASSLKALSVVTESAISASRASGGSEELAVIVGLVERENSGRDICPPSTPLGGGGNILPTDRFVGRGSR